MDHAHVSLRILALIALTALTALTALVALTALSACHPSTTPSPSTSTSALTGGECGAGDACPSPAQCITVVGMAGPDSARKECWVTCAKEDSSDGCPSGTTCTFMHDGPGRVCVAK
jgi:hypothetical protein